MRASEFINEVELINNDNFELSSLSSENAIKFGDIDNLYKNNQDGFVVYFIELNKKIIAAVVTKQYPNIIQILRTKVDPSYRGKKLTMNIFKNIISYENKNIVSDFGQTFDGRKPWYSLAKEVPVVVMDNTTGEIVSTDINDAYKFDTSSYLLRTNIDI